ncbi:SUMF1/EgtB/PvdO family nonheme iron enzyme [Thioalkalivibrio sp. ALJ3]|uniref:SUMF1/EgtB/PvdO family nonheme iron enzyme n=1 Tax=Thioalkalivibrio sp. ALJ3 TaxID=1240557 RepID=UPI000368FD45|nr:SUMF1/EgtB/PvdO family nonheme iron enzyme [Thioalkalivibrio sp. ALJ3]
MLDALVRQHHRLNAALEATPARVWRNQYHPDLSPIGWHYAHCHFIEAVWLRERILGLVPPRTQDWHDLYFPELSPKWRRGGRLPALDPLLRWGRELQCRHRDWLASHADIRNHPLMADEYLIGFLAQHHAMHLETLAQVRWFARLQGPVPAHPEPIRQEPEVPSQSWLEWDAVQTIVGSDDVLAFDNEQRIHGKKLNPFAIRRDPVTNAEWLAFIQEDGYRRPELWSREGWDWRNANGIQAPLGWLRPGTDIDLQVLPEGTVQRNPNAPVVGVSRFEADAFARWAGARLPHEHEWEHAQLEGALRGTGRVWEWCENPFAPYPGFRPFPYDEYSAPWFDGHHYVLRGGSDWSDPLLKRPSMRNFFTPEKRHVFAGVRLARTIKP